MILRDIGGLTINFRAKIGKKREDSKFLPASFGVRQIFPYLCAAFLRASV